ncbi:hypothetical protein CGLO_11314 [Colletotrichum gloeosporioides Cg-14]|uniref:Uncharacterized protein n=1 Tax=Colletotrichum gloeosporioides (strain Cg-14) TaxID=1237896 RepID=T0LM58_COLGC|nr:hypothetical protein CGLO_11314 [Colletotrichum gloeosporioides Cg-14]
MSDFTELAAIRAKLKERERTSEYFNQIWEDEALPRLKETMDEGNITDYNISIQADYGESGVLRIVEVVTKKRLPENTNQELRNNVSKIFTPERSLRVTISFTIGVVKRISGTEEPYNADYHSRLMIGDSVGFENGEYAATLGPAIKWSERVGCLVNFHLFDGAPGIKDEQEKSDCYLVHPAGIDCPRGIVPQRIAKLGAHSGFKMYRTQRVSRSIQDFCPKVPPGIPRVETDWAFCDLEGNGLLLQNFIRYAPNDREVEPHSGLISEIFLGSPNLRLVRCTGRSSGFRYASVCETPIIVKQGPGEPTREWYLENVPEILTVEKWNAGGIGIPGDSGAAIIDDETQAFIGHVWGRTHYEEDAPTGRRLAYFSHVMDIFDDFESRYPAMGRPRLRTDTDTTTSAPVQPVAGGRDLSNRVTFVDGEVPRRSKAGLPISVVKLLGRSLSQNSLAHSVTSSSGTTFTEEGITLEIEATGKDIGDFQSPGNSTRSISLRSSDDGLRT